MPPAVCDNVRGLEAHQECGTCRANRGQLPSPGGAIFDDGLWRIEHAIEPLPMIGWLVVKPIRHVTLLSDLAGSEAAALGPLLQRTAAALHEVMKPAKVYSVLFAEQEGFSHIHFHLIPRAADLPVDVRGPAVFQLMARAHLEGNLGDPLDAATVVARIRDVMDRREPG